ncbi:nitroreductase family protein [Gemella sp. GH3]|uniref:nitroreductase family protein n=1 Tax=unclassified Gemella TaxID=2624949 RepID=UPI0015CF9049|nr:MULTISPECIES: nitroreductase family protein [unclassified Gemella]MBF0713533.1 nitroreductase family protein [Gemella sp. GH3.1]NYS50485.1 nitroreductase family protein [Gemella sp. GH3]
MNEVISTIKEHRSNRNFIKGYKLSKLELDTILDCAKQAPSWMNGQHYNIIVVDDQTIKDRLFELSMRNPHIQTSSVFLIFCIDLTRHSLASKKHSKNFDIEDNVDILINSTTDVSLAMQNAATVAESLGYGTVFCGGVRVIAEEIIEMLNIPKYSFPICGLSIGKLDEELTTERVKPRFNAKVNVGYNSYPSSTLEDIDEYNETLEIFAEARETKLWSQKFADVYEKNNSKTKEILKKQGF